MAAVNAVAGPPRNVAPPGLKGLIVADPAPPLTGGGWRHPPGPPQGEAGTPGDGAGAISPDAPPTATGGPAGQEPAALQCRGLQEPR